jgi:hypothetical protein
MATSSQNYQPKGRTMDGSKLTSLYVYYRVSFTGSSLDESDFNRWVRGLGEIVAVFSFAKNPIVTSVFERW